MDKTLKRKLLKALRSGKYKQTTNGLREYNKFCVLGVLLDVYDKSKWHLGKKIDGKLYYNSEWFYGRNNQDTCVPPSIARKIGLKLQDAYTLIDLNDYDQKTFAEIADWIDENL